MTFDLLKFSFDEQPDWRKTPKTTTEMVADVTKRRLEYERLSKENELVKQFCANEFANAMTVGYIHSSLCMKTGDMVGTQTFYDTKEVLAKSANNGSTTTETEKKILNTHRAMERFHGLHKSMGSNGWLTVQEICDIHKVLLQDLHKKCGKIREAAAETKVFTEWRDEVYYYPQPKEAREKFYDIIDHHNKYMKAAPTSKESKEYTAYIFKCAARLLFEFVDTHPFSDGNGRMCRLLANYVVGLITPFPVSIFHNADPARCGRDDYVNAIVHCRKHRDVGPRGLVAMLVEGAWRGWETLFKTLERRHQLQPGIDIGPIVIKKSACNTEYVSERVDRLWSRVKTRGVADHTKEQVVELIVDATQKADVSSLERSQHLPIHVTIADDIRIELQIFNIN